MDQQGVGRPERDEEPGGQSEAVGTGNAVPAESSSEAAATTQAIAGASGADRTIPIRPERPADTVATESAADGNRSGPTASGSPATGWAAPGQGSSESFGPGHRSTGPNGPGREDSEPNRPGQQGIEQVDPEQTADGQATSPGSSAPEGVHQFGGFGSVGHVDRSDPSRDPVTAFATNGSAPPRPAARTDRQKDRRALAVAAGALGLLLVVLFAVSAMIARMATSDQQDAADLAAPFLEAASSLGSAPGITYTNDDFDLEVTSFGDFTGTVSLLGEDAPMLRANDRIYAEVDGLTASTLTSNWQLSSTENDWVELSPEALQDSLYVDTEVPDSPASIARRLTDELNSSSTDFQPSPYATGYGDSLSDDGQARDGWTEVTLDGTAAYEAQTDAGPVFISESSPHTVLQIPVALLTGDETDSDSSAPDSTSDSVGTNQDTSTDPDAQTVALTQPRSSGGPEVYTYGGVNLTEMTAEQVSAAYDDLLEQSRKLKEALSIDVVLTTGTPKIKCTLSSCRYGIKVTVTPTSTGQTKITGSTARVGLTVNFEINDKEDVASCSSAATFTMQQTKTLSCSTTKTANRMRKAYNAAKDLASSQASPGEYYRWEVPYNGYGEVKGIAKINLTKLSATLEDRRDQIDDGSTGSTS